MYGYQRGKWVGRIYESEINMNQKKIQKQCLIKAYHSSILAWRIPGMEEPGGLPSMGSHRVGHD